MWSLKSATGTVLCLLYIAADAGKLLLVTWLNGAHPRGDKLGYSPASVLLLQQALSLALSLAAALVADGARGVTSALSLRDVARGMPVASCFVVSKCATFLALAHVNAGTVKIATQFVLPTSAVLSRIVLAKGYTVLHWLAILSICACSTAFNALQLKTESPELRQANAVGLTYCGVVVASNSFGSLIGERHLLRDTSAPLSSVKAQLLIGEILVLVLTLMADADARERGWFAGWDWRMAVCALGWVPSTWLSTVITRQFSTVMKNALQCAAAMATVLLSGLAAPRLVPPLPETLLAWLTVHCVLTFSLIGSG